MKTYSIDTGDLWHFKMVSSTRCGFPGIRKVGKCRGGLYCPNMKCNFRATSKNNQANRTMFISIKKDFKKCFTCGFATIREECPARKLVEFDPKTNNAFVYYIGEHTCRPLDDTQARKADISNRVQHSEPKTAKKLVTDEIRRDFDSGNLEAAENTAMLLCNKRLVGRVQNEKRDILTPDARIHIYDRTSFDAVGLLKKRIDYRDHYLIYDINNSNLSGGVDYIFQTTKTLVQLGLQMDIDGQSSPMQLEDVYFDGCHSRAEGFITFALWTTHPAARKHIILARCT